MKPILLIAGALVAAPLLAFAKPPANPTSRPYVEVPLNSADQGQVTHSKTQYPRPSRNAKADETQNSSGYGGTMESSQQSGSSIRLTPAQHALFAHH